MSLPRSSEGGTALPASRKLALLFCIGMFAGCAAGPGTAPADATVQSVAAAEIPPATQTLYEQAVAVMAAGDRVDAELRFKEFLLEYPDYPGAYVNLAILQARNGDDAAAEASIAKALALDPGQPEALNQLGMLRRRQGRFEEAETAYLKAVTADPDYPLAHYNLGVLNELYLRRLDSALQYFERYQELGGDDEQVAMWIADLKRRVSASQRTANAE